MASELEGFFNSAEECAAYETFCAEQERGLGEFTLAEPALVCRWRMAKRRVPLLNRHIRALAHRTVNGAPLTHNMLSWAKQHVEWSLDAGSYEHPNGVLMLVVDVNGDALMSVGPYEPLADCTTVALIDRASAALTEANSTGVAPELLGTVCPDGRLVLAAFEDEPLCGMATLVEQLARTKGYTVERAFGPASPCTGDVVAGSAGSAGGVGGDAGIEGDVDGAAANLGTRANFASGPCSLFCSFAPGEVPLLISDEHGVVVAVDADPDSPVLSFAHELERDVAKLFA